jgi:hypothetical protein
LLLFLAVNFSYLWEENSGAFGFYFRAFLTVSFLLFVFIQLIAIIIMIFKKKFGWKRILLTVFNIVLLVTLYMYPQGIFKPTETREVFLKAYQEETTNCTTTLQLFRNGDFKERNICTEITSAEGIYIQKNDTLFFTTKIIPRGSEKYFDYAIIREFKNRSEIVRLYQNDTTEYRLSIVRKE